MISRKVVLHFPKTLVNKPIICQIVKKYELEFNILKASVTPDEEGLLVLELTGKEEGVIDKAVKELRDLGVSVQPLSKDVVKNEDNCTHCGVCVVYCPTSALYLDEDSKEVKFVNEKCIGCEICVKICPYRAMEVHF